MLIEGHTVVTVAFQGWSALKNGELLAEAEASGFDLFITADQELFYQQNLSGRKIALLVLSTNNWERIKAGISAIVAAIPEVPTGGFSQVEIPETSGRP